MKLIDLVENINGIDDNLTIFQETRDDPNSDIILANAEEDGSNIKIENGKEYYYLIEIFLAKEFIEDWIRSLDYSPSQGEIANRLYEYAINDA